VKCPASWPTSASSALTFAYRRRHQISRPVRGASQDHHERTDGKPELHRIHRRVAHLVGAGSAEGSLDAANILKPALSPRRHSVHRRHHTADFASPLRRDRSLERRFQAVKVPPPNEADASRSFTASRSATRSSTPSATRMLPSSLPSPIQVDISPTVSCPTRLSTSSTKQARASNFARPHCPKS